MEQPIQVKCHLCGESAAHVYSYARLNAQEALLGVIHRGVCKQCLDAYIEEVKKDHRKRSSEVYWAVVLVPLGALLAAFAKSMLWQVTGLMLALFSILLPIGARLAQRREALRARHATPQENEAKYSEKICREDALSTSRQTNLIPLRDAYMAEEYPASRISEGTGVGRSTAVLIKDLAIRTAKCRHCGK